MVRRLALAVLVCGCATTSSSGGGSLYTRLGEKEGIRAAVTAIIDRALADPKIRPFFRAQAEGLAGHPTRAQVERCLTEMLAAAAGGPGRYPVTLPDGYACRSMTESHKQIGVGDGEFSLFIALVSDTLTTMKVAPADREAVLAALEGTRGEIVQP